MVTRCIPKTKYTSQAREKHKFSQQRNVSLETQPIERVLSSHARKPTGTAHNNAQRIVKQKTRELPGDMLHIKSRRNLMRCCLRARQVDRATTDTHLASHAAFFFVVGDDSSFSKFFNFFPEVCTLNPISSILHVFFIYTMNNFLNVACIRSSVLLANLSKYGTPSEEAFM